MKVAIVLGTRPEIIKLAPIIRILERGQEDYFILHTGQHYSYNMDTVFFEQLKLPRPKYSLNVGSGTHAEETGKMMMGIEKVLTQEKPSIVLVQGDTNTVLAGALAAVKLGIKVGHVEAGLRSFDRSMPEEINRIVADHVSDLLFAPTEKARSNLVNEGVSMSKIFITGNTIVDAVLENLKLIEQKSKLISEDDDYFLLTLHRQENVDNPSRFRDILQGLKLIHKEFHMPIVWPIHPRAKRRMQEFNLKCDCVNLTESLDYLSFLSLEKDARLILTDSGGVQEEACILKVPCVTIRDNTERPETLEVGANVLAGTNPSKIVESVKRMLHRKNSWENPFGDGKAANRIIALLKEMLG